MKGLKVNHMEDILLVETLLLRLIFQARAIQSSCIYHVEILLISNDRFLKQLLICFLILPFLERLGVIGGIRFISGMRPTPLLSLY